jgi:hypothetical protein
MGIPIILSSRSCVFWAAVLCVNIEAVVLLMTSRFVISDKSQIGGAKDREIMVIQESGWIEVCA